MRVNPRKRSPDQQQTELYDKVTKIETLIIQSISKLKKQKKYYQCKHYMDMDQDCEDYNSHINYYDKFWKMYLMNQVCMVRIQEMKKYIESQGDQILKIQTLFQKHQTLISQKGKRKLRRTAQQIEKRYTCPYERCFKVYGSDVSLNLHIKLKHNGGSKTDRQKAAQCIVQSLRKGQAIPKFRIQLPPDFIDQCVRNFNSSYPNSNQNQARQQIFNDQQQNNSPQINIFRNTENHSSQILHANGINFVQSDSINQMHENQNKQESPILDQQSQN